MIELRELRYFLAVADEEHFTRAAGRLGVAQPAVSQQIRLLERQLGVRLFDRSPHGVRLTDAARALVPHARAALMAVEAGRAEIAATAGALRGTLTIGLVSAAAVLRVPAMLASFHHEHPEVRISVRQAPSEVMLSDVRDGALDLAVIGLAENTKAPGVVVHQLLTEPLVAVIARNHRWHSRTRLRLEQLRSKPLVTLAAGAGLRAVLEHSCREAGFEPTIVCETNELRLALELVATGIGIAVVPRSATADSALPIRAIPLIGPTPHRHLALVRRESGPAGPAARTFLAMVLEHISGQAS